MKSEIQKSNRACLLLILLTSVLISGVARAQDPPPIAFEYEPFPSIPSTVVEENSFAADLVATCQILATSTVPPRHDPAGCEGVPAGAKPKALEEQVAAVAELMKAQEELEKAKKAVAAGAPVAATNAATARVSGACGAAKASVDAIAKRIDDLQRVCRVLRAPSPQIQEADLVLLRNALKDQQLLTIVGAWGGEDEAAFLQGIRGAAGRKQSPFLPGVPSLGSLSDQLIRGMGEFLAKRAQAEALRYLRKQLKEKLCEGADPFANLRKAAFSNVCVAIETLDDKMSLDAISSFMRAAAEKDLKKLPDLLLDFTVKNDVNHAEVAFGARVALASFTAVRKGRAPFNVLYSLGELDKQTCEATGCQRVGKAMRFASAVAYALAQGGDDWHEIVRGFKPTDQVVMAVAVLLLVEKRVGNLPQAPPAFVLDVVVLNRFLLQPFGIVTDALDLVKIAASLEARMKGALSEQARRDILAEGLVESMERMTRIVETLDRILNTKPTESVTTAMGRARAAVNLAAALVQADYGAAGLATIDLSLEFVDSKALDKWAIRKHVPLIVELASAQSSQDVAATFDAYAAPLGTYELKYKKSFIGINAFVGAHLSAEYLNSQGVEGWNPSFGVFAPVGVHASFDCDWTHLGIMLSLLDLGAVTTIRTGPSPKGDLEGVAEMGEADSKPAAKAAPEIGFAQVFSPGVFVVIGLFESPFVLGGGVSFSPELREVSQAGLTEELSTLRVGGFVAVDVPILPLN